MTNKLMIQVSRQQLEYWMVMLRNGLPETVSSMIQTALESAPLSPDHSGGGAGMVDDDRQALQDRHEAWKAGEAHGIESAARLIEKRMEDYINEHGSFDPETGAVEFPGNGEECVGELVEISEAIRAIDKVKELNQ